MGDDNGPNAARACGQTRFCARSERGTGRADIINEEYAPVIECLGSPKGTPDILLPLPIIQSDL